MTNKRNTNTTLELLFSVLVGMVIVVLFIVSLAVIELLSSDIRNAIQQNIPTEVHTQPYKHI